jgi:hypothetical protein
MSEHTFKKLTENTVGQSYEPTLGPMEPHTFGLLDGHIPGLSNEQTSSRCLLVPYLFLREATFDGVILRFRRVTSE